MRLLTTFLTAAILSTLSAPAFADGHYYETHNDVYSDWYEVEDSEIEGVNRKTYDRNSEILKMNRSSEYNKSEDFYYDYKNSDDYLEEDTMNTNMDMSEDMDSEEDTVINGAF